MAGAKLTKLEAGLRPHKDQTKTIVQGPKTREPKTKQTSVFIKSQKKFCAHKSEVEPTTKVTSGSEKSSEMPELVLELFHGR